jgi:hypothetical protein
VYARSLTTNSAAGVKAVSVAKVTGSIGKTPAKKRE